MTDDKLSELFKSYTEDPAEIEKVSSNAKAMALTDAKKKIADIIINLALNNEN